MALEHSDPVEAGQALWCVPGECGGEAFDPCSGVWPRNDSIDPRLWYRGWAISSTEDTAENRCGRVGIPADVNDPCDAFRVGLPRPSMIEPSPKDDGYGMQDESGDSSPGRTRIDPGRKSL